MVETDRYRITGLLRLPRDGYRSRLTDYLNSSERAFVALTDDTVMSYLCSTGYDPAAERTVHPLDPALHLPWPPDLEPVLSDKDRTAPTLAEAAAADILPHWSTCQRRYAALRAPTA